MAPTGHWVPGPPRHCALTQCGPAPPGCGGTLAAWLETQRKEEKDPSAAAGGLRLRAGSQSPGGAAPRLGRFPRGVNETAALMDGGGTSFAASSGSADHSGLTPFSWRTPFQST